MRQKLANIPKKRTIIEIKTKRQQTAISRVNEQNCEYKYSKFKSY